MLTRKNIYILFIFPLAVELTSEFITKFIFPSIERNITSFVILALLASGVYFIFSINRWVFASVVIFSVILFNYQIINILSNYLAVEVGVLDTVEGPPCRINPIESHTIIFEVGNTSCAFVGNIALGEKQSYTIEASIGQALTITTQGDVIVEVYNKSGQKILSGDASSSLKTSRMIALPYTITLSGKGDFKLKAEIP